MTSITNFNWSQMANFAGTFVASRIPAVAPWAETIGDLAEQASELSQIAQEGCQ